MRSLRGIFCVLFDDVDVVDEGEEVGEEKDSVISQGEFSLRVTSIGMCGLWYFSRGRYSFQNCLFVSC